MNNNDIYYNSLVYVLHKVTPNLRYIFMHINTHDEPEIILKAYYEASHSDIETELLEDIADSIAAMTETNFHVTYVQEVTTVPYKNLDNSQYLLYGRYEQF